MTVNVRRVCEVIERQVQNRASDQALQAECCFVRRGNRVFQFALKYFTAFTVMLVIILILQDSIPAVRAYPFDLIFSGSCDKKCPHI